MGSQGRGRVCICRLSNAADPLDRLLAYVDFRKAILQGELPDFTCFAGTTVQEVYETHPSIRDACGRCITEHAATLEPDIAEAIRKYSLHADWTPMSLALYTQAVIQGAFILAKAQDGAGVAADCLDHLRRYLEMLFTQPRTKEKQHVNRKSAGSGSHTQSIQDQTSQDKAAILALIEASHQAHHDKDASAIAAPFAPDAVLFDLAPPLVHRGINIPEKQAWLDSWNGPIDLESRDLNITVSGDFAFGYGFYRMNGSPREARRAVSFWMRMTVCLHREKDGWRIVHEHTSVPFYMDGSLRPAFDLNP